MAIFFQQSKINKTEEDINKMDVDTLVIYYEKLVKQAYEQAIEMDKVNG